jgi:hypothetical protein
VTRAPGVALLFLAAAGVLLLLVGAAMVVGGITIPDLVRAQIPDAALVDSAEVGGAMVALGGLSAILGLVHLAAIPAVRRGQPIVVVAGITISATLSVLAAASAAGALVALASASGSAATMIPAAIGLLLVALAYAWLGAVLAAVRNGARPR